MGDIVGGTASGHSKASGVGVGDSKLELGRLGRDHSPSAHSRHATGKAGVQELQ